MPTINVALFPAEDVIIRGAIAKVLTRPSLGSLTPDGSVDGVNCRVTFGNPQLDPFRATAFDLSTEWCFALQSIFSIALFKKNVESFPVSATLYGLSKRAYNGTLYYEDAKFSARGSISYRSPYIDGTSATGKCSRAMARGPTSMRRCATSSPRRSRYRWKAPT